MVLSLSEDQEALKVILHHWQETVDINLPERWDVTDDIDTPWTDALYTASLFNTSTLKIALYFTLKSYKKIAYLWHLTTLCNTLSANTGDIFWLFDRYLAGYLPNRGELDLAAVLEFRNYVYHSIANFGAQRQYEQYPHLRTPLALPQIA